VYAFFGKWGGGRCWELWRRGREFEMVESEKWVCLYTLRWIFELYICFAWVNDDNVVELETLSH
jgi:hypothetical protein